MWSSNASPEPDDTLPPKPEPENIQLTDEQVRQYANLYESETGEELTMEEAREIATRLVRLYVLLYWEDIWARKAPSPKMEPPLNPIKK